MNDKAIFLIYDGACPMCRNFAKVVKIRKAVGKFEIINARTDNKLVKEVQKLGYDLDNGIVVIYSGNYYYGKEAMNILAILSSNSDWVNKISAFIFRSKALTFTLYPILKFIRRCLLFVIGIPKIEENSTTPIFAKALGSSWDKMPAILKDHYLVKPFSDDVSVYTGIMDISFPKALNIFSPLIKLLGVLSPISGEDIETKVYCSSGFKSNYLKMERNLNFQNGKHYSFYSKLYPVQGNELVEVMKSGLGWHFALEYKNNKLLFIHKSYKLKILGIFIPLPAKWLMGTPSAEQYKTTDNSFEMVMEIKHPIFGVTYKYQGRFYKA